MATEQDIVKIMMEMEAAFPTFYRHEAPNMIDAQARLWAKHFAETNVGELQYAVHLFIANDTRGFPPSIGQLNQIIREAHGGGISEIEAWQMVKRAIRESYDYDSANAEWAKLPEDVRAPIKPGDLREWGSMDSSIVNSTISASYRRSYVEKRKRAEEMRALPTELKNLLPLRAIGGGE